jgi:hypothetical protein
MRQMLKALMVMLVLAVAGAPTGMARMMEASHGLHMAGADHHHHDGQPASDPSKAHMGGAHMSGAQCTAALCLAVAPLAPFFRPVTATAHDECLPEMLHGMAQAPDVPPPRSLIS